MDRQAQTYGTWQLWHMGAFCATQKQQARANYPRCLSNLLGHGQQLFWALSFASRYNQQLTHSHCKIKLQSTLSALLPNFGSKLPNTYGNSGLVRLCQACLVWQQLECESDGVNFDNKRGTLDLSLQYLSLHPIFCTSMSVSTVLTGLKMLAKSSAGEKRENRLTEGENWQLSPFLKLASEQCF